MSAELKICTIEPGLKEKLKKFRFRKDKTNAAIVMKIDPEAQIIFEDKDLDPEELEDISIDDLANEIPAHQPRYIAYSYCYKHSDGRISYPLVFIFMSPQGCKPEFQMMYAGSKNHLVQEGQFTKVFELRSTEEMTEEWLLSKLSYFK